MASETHKNDVIVVIVMNGFEITCETESKNDINSQILGYISRQQLEGFKRLCLFCRI